MVNEPSGSMNSVGQPYHFHYSSGYATSGITGSRRKEVQFLSLDFRKFSSLPPRIQISGGPTVLSIWKTPSSSGDGSPEYTISHVSRDITAIPLSSNVKRPSTTDSPTRLTARQPERRSSENQSDDDAPFWSLHGNFEMEEDPILPEPVSLSDLPNPWGDQSPIDLEQTSLDCMMSTDSDSEESVILPRNWRNVLPRDVCTTTYT